MGVRLNLYIAKGSHYSRRKADALILSGGVRVNNTIVRQPYYRIGETDEVSIRGNRIAAEKLVYLALNKPAGYTCTCADTYALKKVTDILPPHVRRVYPVGRLDKNSRGLLLLTNDGAFCFRVTHPRFLVDKEYRVTITPGIREKDRAFLTRAKEVLIRGVPYRLKAVTVEQHGGGVSRLNIIATEGKKRHIRVIFSSLGYRVVDLQRVRIGTVRLGDLKEGAYRFLTEAEVASFVIGEFVI